MQICVKGPDFSEAMDMESEDKTKDSKKLAFD